MSHTVEYSGGNNSNYYGGLMTSIATGGRYGTITGGGYKTGGNYKSLENYANGIFSTAKEKLIRSIAKDVCKTLKVPASFADSAPIGQVVSKFASIVPDPRNNKKIKANSKMHSEICKTMAKAINKTYKADIINENDSTENICQNVSELLYTLFTGLHSEFLTVGADISRIMSNLNILQSYIDGLNTKLIKDLEGVSSTESTMLKDAYKALSSEIKRQHSYLANLSSGVVDPTKKSLIDLVEKNKEFKGLVKDLSLSMGTREFSDKLSYMLNGTYNVSQSAALVDKALKKLGMSVAEYKNTKGLTDLRNKLYKKLVDKKPTTKNIADLVKSIDIVARSDLSHDDIAAHLSKKGGVMGGDHSVGEDDGFSFGANLLDDNMYNEAENVYSNRRHATNRSIERTLANKDKTKKKLFQMLNNQIKSRYNKITIELSKIAKKMGHDIKINDSIHTFMRQLSYFDGVQPDRKNLHKALSGYRLDTRSQYIKNDYVTSLYTLSDAADECAKGTGSSAFKELSNALDDLIELIDGFNKNITKSLTDVHVDADREKMGGGKCNGANAYHLSVYGGLVNALKNGGTYSGGDLGEYNRMSYATGISKIAGMEMTFGGNDEEEEINGDNKVGQYGGKVAEMIAGGDEKDYVYLSSIKKSIREIEYYYRIANVKSGMAIASSQQKNYTDDYENILGEECAILIDKINQKYQWLTCREDIISDRETVDKVGSSSMCKMYTLMRKTAETANTSANDFRDKWEGFVFALEYIRSAKVEMIEASQALDLYLSKFTESIQNNPDTVKNFLHLLNNLEVVAKWFTDKSGDNLVHVFRADQNAEYKPVNKNHYYEEFIAADNNNNPIIEGIKLSKENVKNFIIMIEKSFKSMRALENIILTFSKIHDANKSLMSPGLMFKAFMKYAVASCLGLGNKTAGISPRVGLLNEAVIADMKLFLRKIGETRNIYDPLEIGETLDLTDGDVLITTESKLYRNKDNMYLQTEDIYTRCIKSLVSKVFVVVGAYSLFHRPPKSLQLNDGMSNRPLRQIMGGNAMGGFHNVEIIPEATELYIRLILLAEWYREVFGFKEGRYEKDYENSTQDISYENYKGSMDKIISMIPAFDGIWSGFIKDIFIDGMNIGDGNYTEYTSANIISHINDIYRHYKPKYGANCCIKILENFVSEVNLRYGMIKRSEIDKYLTDKYKGLESKDEYGKEDDPEDDYDLLGYNETFDSNKIPSRKFQRVSSRGPRGTALLNKNFIKEMDDFRKLVTKNLKLSTKRSDGKDYDNTFADLGAEYAGLDDIIRNVKKRLSKSDKSEHFRIIQSSIMGTEKFAAYDYDIMLMFHESVVNPLTILYSTYKIINDWNGFINVFDCGENYTDGADNFSDGNIIKLANTCYQNLMNKNLGGFNKQPYLYFYYLLERSGDPLAGPSTASIGKNLLPDGNPIPLLKKIMEKIMYLVCDKNPMCEVKFSGSNGYPMISTDRLKECVETLILCVEKSINKFKKILPRNFVSRYEKQDGVAMISLEAIMIKGDKDNTQIVNSLYYIKEHLYDRILCDKYGLGISKGNTALKNIWNYLTKKVDKDSDKYDDMMQELLIFKKESTSANRGAAGGLINGVNMSTRETLNLSRFPGNRISIHDPNTFTGDSVSLIAKMIIDDSNIKNVNPLITKTDGDPLASGDKKISVLTGTTPANAGHIGIKDLYNYTDDVDTVNSHKNGDRGLIIKFNNLLYNYILMFTEIQSNKIYLPLLQQFVNVLSDEVMDYNNTLDDTIKANTTDVTKSSALQDFIIQDGEKRSKYFKNRILFKTMAAAIRSIVTNKKSVASANILHFAEDNLINVPDYMKDKMMAYLPIFNKHLNIISTQAKFIKVTLESSSLKMKTNKGDYINSFDKIIKGCYALQGCINSVSNELADIPLYFETYKNSISDYKNRNGHLPFMPLSHTSHLLNNHIRLTEHNQNRIIVDTADPSKPIYHAIMIGGKKGRYGGGGVYRGGYIPDIVNDIIDGTNPIVDEKVHAYELYDALYVLVELLEKFVQYNDLYMALEVAVWSGLNHIIEEAKKAINASETNLDKVADAAKAAVDTAKVNIGAALVGGGAIADAAVDCFDARAVPTTVTNIDAAVAAFVNASADTIKNLIDTIRATASNAAGIAAAIETLKANNNGELITKDPTNIDINYINILKKNVEYTKTADNITVNGKDFVFVNANLYPRDKYINVCDSIIKVIDRIKEIVKINTYRVGNFITATDDPTINANTLHINKASNIFDCANLLSDIAMADATHEDKFYAFGVLNLINNEITKLKGVYSNIITPDAGTFFNNIKVTATGYLNTFIDDGGVNETDIKNNVINKIDGLLKNAINTIFKNDNYYNNIPEWYTKFDDTTNSFKGLSLKHIIYTFIKAKRLKKYEEVGSYEIDVPGIGNVQIKNLTYKQITEAIDRDALSGDMKHAVNAKQKQIENELKKILDNILDVPFMKKPDGTLTEDGLKKISEIVDGLNRNKDATKITVDRNATTAVTITGGAIEYEIPPETASKAASMLGALMIDKGNVLNYLKGLIATKKNETDYLELYRLTLDESDPDYLSKIDLMAIPSDIYGDIKNEANKMIDGIVANKIKQIRTMTGFSDLMNKVLIDEGVIDTKMEKIYEDNTLYDAGGRDATRDKIKDKIKEPACLDTDYEFLDIEEFATAFNTYHTELGLGALAPTAPAEEYDELLLRIKDIYTSLDKKCMDAIKLDPNFENFSKAEVEKYLKFALDSINSAAPLSTTDTVILNHLTGIVKKAGMGDLETKLEGLINDNKALVAAERLRINANTTAITELEKMNRTKQADLDVTIDTTLPTTATVPPNVIKENNKLEYNLNIGLLPMPKISNGSESFIYAYGTRGLFSDNIEPNIKLAPGVNNTVDIFNSKPQAVTGGNMDPKLVNDSFVASVHLMRYCTDYIYHKTFLMDNDMDKTTLHYIVARSTADKKYYNVLENLSCQTARSRSKAKDSAYDLAENKGIRNADDDFFLKTYNIIMLINNDNYKESLYRMMKCLTNDDKGGFSDTISDREKMRVYNILDTNIVPINFHALQRELPYSNIFNYSYTFDELVKEKFGVIYNSYNEGKMKWDDTSTGTLLHYNEDPYTGDEKKHKEWIFKFAEDQLVDILIKPYAERSETNYKNTIFKLMVGADGISSGRPKYLSDQLWNKVLLNTIYRYEAEKEVNDLSTDYKNTKNALGKQFNDRGIGNEPSELLYLANRDVNKKGYSEPKKPSNMSKFAKRASEGGTETTRAIARGAERYDTYLIRNIEWFVHLQRCMRTLMKDHLEWVDDAVVTKSNSVAASITEYKNDNVFDPDDF